MNNKKENMRKKTVKLNQNQRRKNKENRIKNQKNLLLATLHQKEDCLLFSYTKMMYMKISNKKIPEKN